jgi:hypothetical protein
VDGAPSELEITVAYDWKTDVSGLFSRHSDDCPARDGLTCTCGPLGYRASVRDSDTNLRAVSPLFATAREALAWQHDQTVSDETPQRARSDRPQLSDVIADFLQFVENDVAWNGESDRYSHDRVRQLRAALSYADTELGALDIHAVRRRHVQGLLEQLRAAGAQPARVLDVANALQELYAYAVRRGLVGFSPAVELDLPELDAVASSDVPQLATAIAYAQPTWMSPELAAAPRPDDQGWTPPPSFASLEDSQSAPEPRDGDQGFASGERPVDRGEAPQPAGATPPWTMGPQPPPAPPPTVAMPPYASYPPPYPPPYAPPYPTYLTAGQPAAAVPQVPGTVGYAPGPLTTIVGPPAVASSASFDATMQERWLWWTVRIIVIMFVLIALVLVAESV